MARQYPCDDGLSKALELLDRQKLIPLVHGQVILAILDPLQILLCILNKQNEFILLPILTVRLSPTFKVGVDLSRDAQHFRYTLTYPIERY